MDAWRGSDAYSTKRLGRLGYLLSGLFSRSDLRLGGLPMRLQSISHESCEQQHRNGDQYDDRFLHRH